MTDPKAVLAHERMMANAYRDERRLGIEPLHIAHAQELDWLESLTGLPPANLARRDYLRWERAIGLIEPTPDCAIPLAAE